MLMWRRAIRTDDPTQVLQKPGKEKRRMHKMLIATAIGLPGKTCMQVFDASLTNLRLVRWQKFDRVNRFVVI